jgi:hypothetical protein
MLKLGGGIALLMVAAFMTIGMIAAGGGEGGLGVQIFTALIAIGIPGGGGVALLRSHLRERRGLAAAPEVPRLPRERWSAELIKLAKRHGGRVTLVEAVAESSLTPEEAQQAFDELCRDGHAEPQVTDSGLVVYAFRDILLLPEKHESRGLLD